MPTNRYLPPLNPRDDDHTDEEELGDDFHSNQAIDELLVSLSRPEALHRGVEKNNVARFDAMYQIIKGRLKFMKVLVYGDGDDTKPESWEGLRECWGAYKRMYRLAKDLKPSLAKS